MISVTRKKTRFLPSTRARFLSSSPHVDPKASAESLLHNRWSSRCIPSRQVSRRAAATHSTTTSRRGIHLKVGAAGEMSVAAGRSKRGSFSLRNPAHNPHKPCVGTERIGACEEKLKPWGCVTQPSFQNVRLALGGNALRYIVTLWRPQQRWYCNNVTRQTLHCIRVTRNVLRRVWRASQMNANVSCTSGSTRWLG